MSWGPKQIFTTTIASGASTSATLDFGDKSFSQFAVKYATMSTGAQLSIWGCDTPTGTFGVIHERVNTAPVQHQALTIATSVSGLQWACFQGLPFRYVQFVASAVVSGGVALTVLAGD